MNWVVAAKRILNCGKNNMKQSEFKKRRKHLIQHVGEGNIALIGSASMRTRNRDVDYPFRQDSDFYYLTGFNEPDALLLITAGSASKSYLFNLPKDPLQEQGRGSVWDKVVHVNF